MLEEGSVGRSRGLGYRCRVRVVGCVRESVNSGVGIRWSIRVVEYWSEDRSGGFGSFLFGRTLCRALAHVDRVRSATLAFSLRGVFRAGLVFGVWSSKGDRLGRSCGFWNGQSVLCPQARD